MEMNVRRARAFALKTQADVAKELGLSVRTYSKLEKKPENFTISQAKKFSKLVNLPYDDIFFSSEST